MTKQYLQKLSHNYLSQLGDLLNQLHHVENKMGENLANFESSSNVSNQIELESSIAYFEKHVIPIISRYYLKSKILTEWEDSFTFTLYIDRNWQAQEFEKLFSSIQKLYTIWSMKGQIEENIKKSHAPSRRLSSYLSQNDLLTVEKIRFGSFGLINFQGLAEAIKELRETIDGIISLPLDKILKTYDSIKYERPNRIKEQELKQKQLDLEIKKTESAMRTHERGEELEILTHRKQCLEKIKELYELGEELCEKGLVRRQQIMGDIEHSISALKQFSNEEKIAIEE